MTTGISDFQKELLRLATSIVKKRKAEGFAKDPLLKEGGSP
jgi:hypothetical protein